MSNPSNGPVAAPATSVAPSLGQGTAPAITQSTLSVNVATVLGFYELCHLIAGHCHTGNDFASLARTSKIHWAAVSGHLEGLHNSSAYKLRCNGSGLLRWGGQNLCVWEDGPKFECLDKRLLIPCARPCDRCGVAVCNICRFHVDRTTADPGSAHWSKETPFEDESSPQELKLWRDAKYKYSWGSGWPPRRTDQEKAETILADQFRVYCDRHVLAKKTELMKRLRPGRLPGEYCSCNPRDRFVRNSWFCIACVEAECSKVGGVTGRARSSEYCSEPRCRKPADQTWKQCSWCGSLIDEYTPKGFNVTHRHD